MLGLVVLVGFAIKGNDCLIVCIFGNAGIGACNTANYIGG
jgi:hypothetical protein